MKVDNEMIDRIAALAYLDFGRQEREQIRHDLERILSFVEKLNELDTGNVEPLVYLSSSTRLLREDRRQPPEDRNRVLINAPDTDGEYFLVPKVLENNKRGKNDLHQAE